MKAKEIDDLQCCCCALLWVFTDEKQVIEADQLGRPDASATVCCELVSSGSVGAKEQLLYSKIISMLNGVFSVTLQLESSDTPLGI